MVLRAHLLLEDFEVVPDFLVEGWSEPKDTSSILNAWRIQRSAGLYRPLE